MTFICAWKASQSAVVGLLMGALCRAVLPAGRPLTAVLVSWTPILFSWFVLHQRASIAIEANPGEATGFKVLYLVLVSGLLASGLASIVGWAIIGRLKHGKRSPTG